MRAREHRQPDQGAGQHQRVLLHCATVIKSAAQCHSSPWPTLSPPAVCDQRSICYTPLVGRKRKTQRDLQDRDNVIFVQECLEHHAVPLPAKAVNRRCVACSLQTESATNSYQVHHVSPAPVARDMIIDGGPGMCHIRHCYMCGPSTPIFFRQRPVLRGSARRALLHSPCLNGDIGCAERPMCIDCRCGKKHLLTFHSFSANSAHT